MKKIYKLALMLLPVSMVSVSCSDFLDRAPGDNMTEEELFSKIETAEAYLDNAYTYLPDFQYNTEDLGGRYKLGDATDEGGFQQESGYTQCPFDINLGSWNSEVMPMQRNWSDYYGCIRRCNMLIKNYDLIPEEMTTGAATNRKERLLGEAYGLRGYYYFLLFKQWGGVPIITSVLDPGDESQLKGIKRASAEETLQRVLDDMDEAIKHLPPKHNDANFGRFTSLIATIVKSQVKLYWASPYWNPDNDMTRWQEAVDLCREALNMAENNGHSLALNYSDLFNKAGLQNEVIWTKNSPFYYECYWWDWYAMPLGYNGWNVDGPLQEIVDAFEMKGTCESPVLGYNADNTQIVNPEVADLYDPNDPYANREDRFYSCILYHGAELQGRPIDVSNDGQDNIYIGAIIRTNYFYNKYLDQEHNLASNDQWTYRRFASIRLAELILNYAEALNELDGATSAVYTLVDRIRDRADQPLLKDEMPGLSKEQMRERIRHERRLELAFENHRFWDVRRWKIAEEVDAGPVHRVEIVAERDGQGNIVKNNYTYPVFQNRVFDPEKHYLFPIPQSEIDKNNALEQNPGW